MWVDAKTFMLVVEKITRLETETERLKEEVETLKKRPIVIETREENEDTPIDSKRILDELLNGTPDEAGRVVYTDGRK